MRTNFRNIFISQSAECDFISGNCPRLPLPWIYFFYVCVLAQLLKFKLQLTVSEANGKLKVKLKQVIDSWAQRNTRGGDNK